MASKHRITVGEELRFDADVQGLKNANSTYADVVRPEAFGAVGNGVADDTAALVAALTNHDSTGRTLWLKPGATYKVTAGLTSTSPRVQIEGNGATIVATLTTFDILTAGPGVVGSGSRPSGFIRNLKVFGPSNAPTSGKAAIKLSGLRQVMVDSCEVGKTDIGYDLVNNCFGVEFHNVRGGFYDSCNVAMNLRTGSESGSDIYGYNCWLSGRVAAVHMSAGGGFRFFGGQFACSTAAGSPQDDLGAVIIGKDYLTSALSACPAVLLNGVSFEGTRYAWEIRSFGETSMTVDSCSFNVGGAAATPPIGIWKADGMASTHARFVGSAFQGGFSGASAFSFTGAQSACYVEESGWRAGSGAAFNAVSSQDQSLLGQSGLTQYGLASSRTSGSARLSIGGLQLRNNSGVLEKSTDGSTWASTGATSATMQVFTANGTWTKPAGCTTVEVVLVGAGGGGGSGRRGAAGSARVGGTGGAGGALTRRRFRASDLPATVSIGVGTGGTGAAAVAVDDTNGNSGSGGSSTSSFGSFLAAQSGGGGGGGTAAAGSVSAGGGGSFAGGNGAAGTAAGAAGATAVTTTDAPSGGGSGGGITTGDVANNGGSAGTVQSSNGAKGVGGTAGGAGPTTATDSLLGSPGYGGGGGAASTSGSAQAGSNGAKYGAGGGGGGASVNGNASGAGGNGADGIVVVYELY